MKGGHDAPEERFHMSLSGQWVGKYSGSNSGTLVIEIDDVGDHYGLRMG